MGLRRQIGLLGAAIHLLVVVPQVFSQNEYACKNSIGKISVLPLQKDLTFLAADSLEGRATGSSGAKKAADYLASNLAEMGLIPMGDNGYFQSIPMHGSQPLDDSQLRLFIGDELQDLTLGQDYLMLKSGAQIYVGTPAQLVFVGYGIIAPEFDYNDYQGIDVSGKIAVFLSGEPKSNDPSYFAGSKSTIYSYPESKQRLATSRGAIGSVLIPNPRIKPENWSKYRQEYAFEDVTLAYAVTAHLALMVSHRTAHQLFQDTDHKLEDIFAMDRFNRIRSFPMAARISFKGEFIERDFIATNVAAVLPGRDPQLGNTYLILSAHFDHFGIGPEVNGDTIYNGALDNAIGVAALLEIARAFTSSPVSPRRSVLFLFLTGEEKGLLGSRYYTDHPVIPLHKSIANINIDGIATLDQFNDVVGIGGEFSTLGEELNKVAAELDLQMTEVPEEFLQAESFERSDQISFAQAGIPAILLMNGLWFRTISREQAIHRLMSWFEQVYHSPFDDLKQDINYDAVGQHTRLIFAFACHLANNPGEPRWYSNVIYANTRLQTQAEGR